MPHTRVWDETVPPNTQAASLGALRMRERAVDVRERMALDHYWNVDVNIDGIHKQVTLPELGADPATVANRGTAYTKDDGAGITHLYYRDSAGTVYKITGDTSGLIVDWNDLTGIPAFVDFLDGLVDPGFDAYIMWDDSLGDFIFVGAGSAGILYSGYVSADGTVTKLPAGWSAVRNSAGNYTVTHNLGLSDPLDLVVTEQQITSGSGNSSVVHDSSAANTFTYRTYNAAGNSNDDHAAYFHARLFG